MKPIRIIALSTGYAVAMTLSSFAQSNSGQTPGGVGNAGQTGAGQEGVRGVPNNNASSAAGVPWQFGAWNRFPWFADPRIRQELRLGNDQFDQLRNNYARSWDVYEGGFNGLPGDLAAEQRSARQRQLGQTFQNEFSGSLDQLLNDPAQRLRFNQLYLQYQGFNAFDDPLVQQHLNLSDRQQRQLRQLQSEWNQQMQTLSRDFAREPNGIVRFNELRQQAGERIANLLTDEQRLIWGQMLGQPFDFPPQACFPPTEASNANDRTSAAAHQ